MVAVVTRHLRARPGRGSSGFSGRVTVLSVVMVPLVPRRWMCRSGGGRGFSGRVVVMTVVMVPVVPRRWMYRSGGGRGLSGRVMVVT